ncbi:MAG: hypothetical protein RQ723_03500 [Desulfuromonadales bacterium]|nr:hypothetical protein [Desulfuromonadales bacterium]
MKDWTGRKLCFECIKALGANMNIGQKTNGRCQRCHREQTVFTVTGSPAIVPGQVTVCPECAHSDGVHASNCGYSGGENLQQERDQIVRLLKRYGLYEEGRPLAEQLEKILLQFHGKG